MQNFIYWAPINDFSSVLTITIRILTIISILIWHIYWRINEKKANKAKVKTRYIATHIRLIKRMPTLLIDCCTIIQLLGLQIFPFHLVAPVEFIGLGLVLLGLFVGIMGRKELDTNWANAHEYQIKKNQELVTSGIYAYIRHPIYIGLILRVTGAQIIAQGLLFLPLFIGGLIISYIQAKKEEKLLVSHFGNQYVKYMKRTKMFIPHIL